MSIPGDALSDVLRMVHLKACVYFVKNMPQPWGMDIPAVANGPLHVVLDGNCVLTCGGREFDLQSGDAVLLPHGARHQMLDNRTTRPEPGPVVMQRLLNGEYVEPVAGATRMLCGHFEWDGAVDHPFFRELPEVVVVRGVFDGPDAQRFNTIVDLIAVENSDSNPGSAAIADRMGEVLFVSLLRTWMIANRPDNGLLATLNDPRLSRALRHIHQRADTDLDLKVLAEVAGMSRTSFAVQFRQVMGKPPAAYLAEWRMLKARTLLVQTELSASDVGSRVGYGSDAAFSRAFKRQYGVSPSAVRKGL